MVQINRMCTLFVTLETDERLTHLILNQENRAMGAGGYAIELVKDSPGGTIHISFIKPDQYGSPKNHVFIRDGSLWATYMSGWVTDLLRSEEIGFVSSQVRTPNHIEDYMRERIAEDERKERQRVY